MLKSNFKFDYYGKEVLGFNERHFWIAGTSEASKKSTPECACFFNPIFHPGYRCRVVINFRKRALFLYDLIPIDLHTHLLLPGLLFYKN